MVGFRESMVVDLSDRIFGCADEPEMSDVPTVSNVRQDLNEWQARHATLVLSAVKVCLSEPFLRWLCMCVHGVLGFCDTIDRLVI